MVEARSLAGPTHGSHGRNPWVVGLIVGGMLGTCVECRRIEEGGSFLSGIKTSTLEPTFVQVCVRHHFSLLSYVTAIG